MKRYRAVIFDFDGTLADSFPWFAAVFNDLASVHRFRPVQESEVAMLRRMDARRIMDHLRIAPWKVPFIAAHMRRLAARDIGKLRLHDGVGEAIAGLSAAGATLAVLSSNTEANVRRVLADDLALRFAGFSCGAPLFGKARQLRALARRLKVDARACIYVGDEVRDGEAARAAGMDFGAVSWGFTAPETLKLMGPSHFFSAVPQLAALAAR